MVGLLIWGGGEGISSPLLMPPRPRPPGEPLKAYQARALEILKSKKKPPGFDAPSPLRAPVIGTKRALVLLVDFSDNPATTPTSHYEELLFSQGTYPTGSMRDYYQEVSYGLLEVVGEVKGWYRAPQTYAYYVNELFGVYSKYPQNVQKIVEDTVILADPEVDFSQYDLDGDGYVDNLLIVHAGPGAERTFNQNDVWSHKWVTSKPIEVDGVKVYTYSMQPEDGTVGVFAHEFGHILGLPDLYDTGYDSQGVGSWCLMAAGSWGGPSNDGTRPTHLCAWAKEVLGWVNPQVISSNTMGVEIPQVEESPFVLKLWTNGNPEEEYFLVENRQKTGFDEYLPGSGLLIYHIDEGVPTNDDQNHYRVGVEQADGLYQLELDVMWGGNYGDGGDPFPGTSNNRNFNASSTPSSKSYGGDPTGVGVLKVSDSQKIMTADIEVEGESYENHNPTIVILQPDERIRHYADTSFKIEWVARDFDSADTLTIDLYYDTDEHPEEGLVLIAQDLPNTGEYLWDCSGVPEGIYFIYGVVKDGKGGIGTDYSARGSELNWDTGEYYGRLYIQHGAGDTFEPNDSFSQAYSITSGTQYYSYIYLPYEEDYYRIELEGPGLLEVSLTNIPPECDYDLRVFDSSQNMLAYSTKGNVFEDPEGVNQPESISLEIESAGIYYLKVEGYTVEDTIYSFDMNNPYLLFASFTPQGEVISISLSTNNFSFSSLPLDSWSEPQWVILTNDGTVTEDFSGTLSPFTSGENQWGIGEENGDDICRVQWSTSGAEGPWVDLLSYSTQFLFAENIPPGGRVTLWVRIQTPTQTASFFPYTAILTISAQKH